MSEIKALEELRGLRDEAASKMVDNPKWVCRRAEEIADEIEAEIAERYMPCPCDADGVPIRVGDVVEFGENRNQGIVKALNEHMVIAVHVDDGYTNYAKYGLLWNADACRHVKPRTLESILCDALADVSCMGDGIVRRFEPDEQYVVELADEIRKLLGAGE